MPKKIVKLALPGDDHTKNPYWTGKRVHTLQELYRTEGDTLVRYDGGGEQQLKSLCEAFARDKLINDTLIEKAGTSALIIERIILMAHRDKASWPEGRDRNIFNRIKPMEKV